MYQFAGETFLNIALRPIVEGTQDSDHSDTHVSLDLWTFRAKLYKCLTLVSLVSEFLDKFLA